MNQTNILVVASSVAALLTLGVVTFSQWVAPWVPLAVGAGWVALWGAAWVTLKSVGDVSVPKTPQEAMPALIAVAVVPVVGMLWMLSPVRAAVVPTALSNSADAVEAIFSDSSRDVQLAACGSVVEVDPAQWSAISDAIAGRPDLAMECAKSLSPQLVDAVADRWATALKRPNMDEATACMLTEKLATLRQGKPQVLTKDLMRCADQSKSEAARACCEQTFDTAVEPIALLDAGTPSPSVLASFIRVQFKAGESLDEELAGRLLDATCEDPESTQVTRAYLPFVRETCQAKSGGWIEAYGSEMWSEACTEELPYFREVRERPLDEAVCRGLETAAVALAVDEAMVDVGFGRSTARAQDGVTPGVLANVASTARARGAGTSGAGIEENREKRAVPEEWEMRLGDPDVIRGDRIDYEGKCRQEVRDAIGEDYAMLLEERGGSVEEMVGADPCDMTSEEAEKLGDILENEEDISSDDSSSEVINEHIDAEEMMRRSPSAGAAEKSMEELKNIAND